MNNTNSYLITETLIQKLPTNSGIYQFKDKNGKIIYIGKAKDLRSRISQYILKRDSRPMTDELMSRSKTIEIILTNSESEALILENSLIKKEQPFFNIELKDDKTYPYLAITDEEWPRLIITRRLSKKFKFFRGPFTQMTLLHSLKKLLQILYPLKYCSNKHPKCCINYQMGICPAPCKNGVDKTLYDENVKSIIALLQGKKWDELADTIKEKIVLNASLLNFEKAAKLRNLLALIPEIEMKYSVEFSGVGAEDFFFFKISDETVFTTVARYRNGKLFSLKSFSSTGILNEMESSISTILTSFYAAIPVAEKLYIYPKLLDKNQVSLLLGQEIKKVGKIPNEILKMLETNTNQTIKVYLNDKMKMNQTLTVLSKFLKTEVNSILCLDISTLYGEYTVAGAIWWENGKFNRQKYRKYKIKTVSGIDDFGSLREVAARLFKRWQSDESEMPSLLLIDGGIGQISSVNSVLKGFVPIAGIIKDRGNKRGKEFLVDLFGNQLVLEETSFALILKAIRNEAHRFSITFNKNLRKDKLISPLTKIKGIGKQKEIALLQKFKTLSALKSATVEELMEVPGISRKIAENIRNNL